MTSTLPALAAVREDRIVELATAITSIRSQASNELEVAELLYGVLDRPGIEVHIEEVVAGRANLVARVRGRGERDPLVLSGHLDASVSSGWSRDPYTPWIDNGRLYGGGIDDMKGAVGAMVATVEAASAIADQLPGDLILHAVMHHDTIGLGEKYILASEGPSRGYAICGEPSSLGIHTANGGALKFTVEFRGETAHISRLEGARDALSAAVDGYAALRATAFPHDVCDRLPDLPRVLIGKLQAGLEPHKVADRAVLYGDIRTVPGMDRVAIKDHLRQTVLSACTGGIDVDVRITAVQRPFIGPRSGPLIDAVAAAHTAIRGTAPSQDTRLPSEAFVTDAADLAAAGLETVVYGPGDWHFGPDRYVEIEDIVDAAKVYLAVALSLR